MTPRVAARHLAALFDGGPKLVLLPGVAAPEALALPGLALWTLGDAMLLRPVEEAAEGEGIVLPAAPGQVLALVAPEAAAAAPLLDWWRGAAPGAVPPVIAAARGEAALPALAARAVSALAAGAEEAAAAQQGLVALRQEHEALRVAQAWLRRAAAQLRPPVPPLLVASAEPSPGGHAVAAREGRLALGQSLGVKLEGLASVALHLKEALAFIGTVLRVRLYGAESGRILGAWVLPGHALAAGWLTLDLPEPVGPVRETAWLEVKAELDAFDRLAFSLGAEAVAPGSAVAVAGGGAETRPLAFGAWSAQPGRCVQPLHWDGEAIGLPAPPIGAPAELPQQIWQAARVPEGRVERLAIGGEPARLVATLAPGEQALVVLPSVPLNGLDLLRAELAVGLGDTAWLEAALWLQPEGKTIGGAADLDPGAPGARWSGWHGGAFGDAACRLALALPPDPSRRAVVALALRNRAAGAEEVLRVEVARLYGTRAAVAPPEAARRPPSQLRLLPGVPAEAPVAAAVRLMERYLAANGTYRHLDLLMEGVRAGERAWSQLRCKLALNGANPLLEFRQRPGWPATFEHWPQARVDAAGTFLHLNEKMLAGGFVRTLVSERDRAMLATVLRLLPAVTATAARDATTNPEEYERWIAAARQLSATLQAGEAASALAAPAAATPDPAAKVPAGPAPGATSGPTAAAPPAPAPAAKIPAQPGQAAAPAAAKPAPVAEATGPAGVSPTAAAPAAG
ncbi:DUF6212 domain-containing protein [Roseicella aquatilis]|uniref:Uncharacterized protein n=1 Tax=Roseicella aquatilis TaxID=2527868 RepID=A0A4V2WM28_9PROT|nr:DUF6212 domain-containing protein [Roseicella aquatilis]TCZ66032.1 hypothetical protein EXY23_02815 [Roseicella aquatilis]